MTRALLPVLTAALLALGALACGSGNGDGDEAGGETTGESAETIEISGTEFELSPATVELDAPGVYTFRFTNDGSTVHALEVEGHGIEEETEAIDAGETAELTVELSEEGEYELYCPVGNHKDQGMEGTVVVGGAAGGTTTHEDTTTDHDETTTEDESGYP